jgi:serine/threonine protein kinase
VTLVIPYFGCDLGFIEHGTLDIGLSLEEIQFITYRLLGALHYLHSADIVHRDLKSSSVLIRLSEEVSPTTTTTTTQRRKLINAKLGSFSQARSLRPPWGPVNIVETEKNEPSNEQAASIYSIGLSLAGSVMYWPTPTTPKTREPILLGNLQQPEFDKLPDPKYNMCYWAPELGILEEKDYACKQFDWKKCDVWSLGCLLAEMLRAGEPLFTAKTARAHMAEILRINECRPAKGLGFLELPDFPIVARWAEKGSVSLKDVVSYIPSSTISKKKPNLYNTQSPTLAAKCLDLLSKLLTFDPESRPSCSELLQHVFFDEMERKACVETRCTSGERLTDSNLVEFVYTKCGGP